MGIKGFKLMNYLKFKIQNPRLNSKGVTMVEALIVIGVVGFAMALMASLTLAGLRAWQKQWTRLKLERQAQSFMYALSYNLRQAQPSTVAISNLSGEMNNSLITFTLVNGTNPVSFYMKTLKSGSVTIERQVVMSLPSGSVSSPTYTPNVLATDVLSLFFTYPNISDTSRIIANISLYATPIQNKDPVFYQAQESIYIRN